uniref:Uncharacterized protein n=1 Tax=Steinernema glaseri TaxID=37863 RepID=A0A1I8A464_9BILA
MEERDRRKQALVDEYPRPAVPSCVSYKCYRVETLGEARTLSHSNRSTCFSDLCMLSFPPTRSTYVKKLTLRPLMR